MSLCKHSVWIYLGPDLYHDALWVLVNRVCFIGLYCIIVSDLASAPVLRLIATSLIVNVLGVGIDVHEEADPSEGFIADALARLLYILALVQSFTVDPACEVGVQAPHLFFEFPPSLQRQASIL